MYVYDTLEKIGFSGMAECFQLAFSDYELEVNWDETYLERRFEGSGVDFSRSYGAFFHGKLVGFLLNAFGKYNGERVLFDAATGVCPEHRGKGIYSKLLKCCEQDFENCSIDGYFLEVLKNNVSAVSIYEKKNLIKTRELICFRGTAVQKGLQQDIPICFDALTEFPLEQFYELVQYPPSFENRFEAVCAHDQNYDVIYTGTKKEINAFVIYDRRSLQVRIIGRRPEKEKELEQLFIHLSNKGKEIPVYNIDSRDLRLLKSLTDIGFQKYCEQYEMKLLK